jgi:hypothetical protein
MNQDYPPLYPDHHYHLLGRAIGKEKLFRTDENFRFFLERMGKYLLPVAGIYSYCLLPDHFHLLARIRPQSAIELHYAQMKEGLLPEEADLPDFIMERFSNLLNSYCKSYNKVYQRKGSLFIDYLKRKEMPPEAVADAICLIHNNPVRHRYCQHPGDWKWSSYQGFFHPEATQLSVIEALSYFGDRSSFAAAHKRKIGWELTE